MFFDGTMHRRRINVLCLALALPLITGLARAQTANAIRNPGFESGTSSWSFFTNGTGSFSSASPGFTGSRSARVAITTTGSNMQLYQTSVRLEPNTSYTLRFMAYSSNGRDVAVSLLKNTTPYTNYGLYNRTVGLSTGWERYTIVFTTTGFASAVTDARFRFWFVGLAAAGETYFLDDVELLKTSAIPAAATITREPLDARVAVGQQAAFSVSASGTSPISYQWQRNGTVISGATSALYTTGPAALADSGAGFRCIVSNALGSDTSVTATLTVLPPLTITFWNGRQQRFGHVGDPVPAVNVLGNVFARYGIRSFGYSLNGSAETALARGPDTRRLEAAGDFNADIPVTRLATGANRVVFRALDSSGTTRRDTVIITYTAGNTWPLPWTATWSSLPSIADGGQILDGRWSIAEGELRTQQVGYDRLVALGEGSWQDYEVTVPVTIHRVNPAGYEPPSNGPAVGFILRWPGHSDSPSSVAGWQPKTGYLPLGALAWYSYEPATEHLEIIGNNLRQLARETTGRRLLTGVRYIFKARVETIAGTGPRYSIKVWPDGQSEPATWDLTGQESLSDPQRGCLVLVAHHVDASFGDVSVRPLGLTTYTLAVSAAGSGSVTRTPDLTAYEPGQIVSLSAVPAFGWTFQGWSGDLTGAANPATITMTGNRSVTATFTGAAPPGSLAGDEFNAPALNTAVWTFVNPLGDASFSMTGTEFSLFVPGGSAHDVWSTGAQAPRIMQEVDNTALEAELRFTGPLSARYQIQGFLAQQDSLNFVRFGFVRDGTRTRAFAATFVSGVPTVRKDTTIAAGNPLYLRVQRTGNNWAQQISYNGSTWVPAGAFSHTLTLSRAGVYFGNAGSPAPAFAGKVDYVRSLSLLALTDETLARTDAGEIPDRIRLEPNFPNPFNPTTTITYAIPPVSSSAARPDGRIAVALDVFDLLGRKVGTLVDELQEPGWYRVVFDGGGLASGTYIYRLAAGGTVTTQKMLLLR